MNCNIILLLFSCYLLTSCNGKSTQTTEPPEDSLSVVEVVEVEENSNSVTSTSEAMPATQESLSSDPTQQAEIPNSIVGKWELNNDRYVSPLFHEEDDKGCTAQFILTKGKVMVKFSEEIEAENEMKILLDGREETVLGTRSGKIFTVSSSDVHNMLMAMDNGNFTFQYMFLEAGASHWGWYNFKIGNQLRQSTQAFNALNR